MTLRPTGSAQGTGEVDDDEGEGQGDGEDGQQIGVVGHLRHPDSAEPLVAQLSEVLHAGIDRRTTGRFTE